MSPSFCNPNYKFHNDAFQLVPLNEIEAHGILQIFEFCMASSKLYRSTLVLAGAVWIDVYLGDFLLKLCGHIRCMSRFFQMGALRVVVC